MNRAAGTLAGASRSKVMAAVTPVIARRSIKPTANRVAVSPEQQLQQRRPRRRPWRQAALPSACNAQLQSVSWRQQASCRAFHAVNCRAPATSTTAPTAIGMACASAGLRMAIAISAIPSGYEASPNSVQTRK